MGTGRSKEGDAPRGSPLLDVETLLRRAGAITPRVRATVRAPPHTRNHGLRGVANTRGYAPPTPRWVRSAYS